MNSTCSWTQDQTDGSLAVFVLYADFAAGIRGKRLSRVIGKIAANVRVSSELWKLDSISPAGIIRRMIAQQAAEADILVIADSMPAGPNPRLNEWLESLVNWKAHRIFPGTLVGLLGDEEHAVDATDWSVNELAAFARKTRMHWRWSSGAREAWENGEWLTEVIERTCEEKRAFAAGALV